MKKRVGIFVAALSILFNLFAFLQISNYAVEDYLLDKKVISFDFREDKTVSLSELLKKIECFSDRYDVEIAQYSFLSQDRIDIYSTDKDEYRELLSIPNLIFNRRIKTHDFEDLLNTGFKNRLYVATNEQEIINQLDGMLSEDCRVYYSDLQSSGETIIFGQIRDQTSVYAGIVYIGALTIIVFAYYSIQRTKCLILELWGYPSLRIFYIFSRWIWTLLFFPGILATLTLTGLVYKFRFSGVSGSIFRTILALNGLVLLVIFIVSIPLFFCFCATKGVVDRAKCFDGIITFCLIIKILAVMMVMALPGFYIRESDALKEQKNSLFQWNDTQKLFNIFEAYSPLYMSDLAEEDLYNRKIHAVYQELRDSGKEFILNTVNFEHPDLKTQVGKNRNIQYSYQLDMNSEEDAYTPYGRCITIDCNYLKTHLTRDIEGNNVLEQIKMNDLVLNVLVPYSLKRHEDTIRRSFSDWFYFQKVEVSNIYREARDLDPSMICAKDLSVNIIYVQDGNQIFTYNVNSGDEDNRIKDPIMMIYTENVDNSYLASCLGGFIFIEASDEYDALREICSITGKFAVPELNMVRSVYDQKGEEIRTLEDNRRSLAVSAFMIFIILNLVLTFTTYVYWMRFFKEIVIRSLFGYRFVQIYRPMIVRNVMINFFAILPAAVILGGLPIYVLGVAAMISVIDYLIPWIMHHCLVAEGERRLAMNG